MRAPRMSWSSGLVLLGVLAAVVLFATGRLEFHPRGRVAGSESGAAHEHGKGGEEEEEGRVRGDKAIFDAEALKTVGFQAAPVQVGSVAVGINATGEVQVPEQRVAQVTARVAGVVREVHRARGDAVAVGAPLVTIESADVGEARSAYATASTEVRVAEANVRYWQRRRDQGFTGADAAPTGWVELDQAIGELGAARTDQAVAQRAAARMRELTERGVRSRTELLQAEAEEQRAAARLDAATRRLTVMGTLAENELNRARQRLEAARAKLRAIGSDDTELAQLAREGAATVTSRFTVRSPQAGVVADRQVTVSQSVDATTKLFTIADLTDVWVSAALYERDVAAVRLGQPAVVRVQALPDAVFRGKVVQVGPGVDEKTRTMPVRVAVRNQSSGTTDRFPLRPGMFATIELETGRKANVPVVPVAAVQTLGGQAVVFVETQLSEGAAFQRRFVTLGARDADTVEVVEGLKQGERVVTTNAYLIKSEFERAKIGGGHAH